MRFTTGAHEAGVDLEQRPEFRFSQPILASLQLHVRQFQLFQVGTVHTLLFIVISAPSRSEAFHVLELEVLWRQASGVDMCRDLNRMMQHQQCDIVEQILCVVLGMRDDRLDLVVGVWERFFGCLRVPFANSGDQILFISAMHAMGTSENDGWVNQRSATNVLVGVGQCHHPRELPELCDCGIAGFDAHTSLVPETTGN